ncbi:MAG: hypothetical protein BAJALOKI1v1_2480003 [Promethearchaeota archaeon]|nr:MAG: hypothetical protein BAJALOKI1v1_2480003 [Candidatus Lokiarchaeota archaeon]
MIRLSEDKIRQEINRIRRRLQLPKSINRCIFTLYRKIELCIISTDPLKLIPLLFLLYLNANDYFVSFYRISEIAYISVDECVQLTEPLLSYEFLGSRSQLLAPIKTTISNTQRNTLRFESFRSKYGKCPICSHLLDEEYLRLFFFDKTYDRQKLRSLLLDHMKNDETFRYVYHRRVTLKIPCILCLLEVLLSAQKEHVWTHRESFLKKNRGIQKHEYTTPQI